MASPDSSVRFGLCGHTTSSDASIFDGRNGANCPVCGRHHGICAEPFLTRNHVPADWLGRDVATRSEAINLKLKLTRRRRDKVSTVEEFVDEILSGHVPYWDLQGELLHSRRTTEPSPHSSSPTWRADTSGGFVKRGVVSMPVGSVLLLDGKGAHFQDITFSGGVVVCAGPDWSGTFSGCTFHRSGLYAAHGAAVALRDCGWHECWPALVASGAATAATCAAGMFHRCFTAVVAERGAAVTLDGCEVSDTSVAVVANDAGTVAKVRGCRLRAINVKANWSCGVSVHGGSAELRNCMMSRFLSAVFARGAGSRVEVHGSHARACETGLEMVGAALGTLRDVELAAAHSGDAERDEDCAILLEEEKADTAGDAAAGGRRGRPAVQLERCTTHGRGERFAGMHVGSGGRAALDRCVLRSGSAVAVAMDPGESRAVLRRCVLEGLQACCTLAARGSMLRLEGCVVEDGAVAAVVAEGGTLELVDTRISGQRRGSTIGMVTVRAGTTLCMQRCELRRGCIAVQQINCDVALRDCRIADMHGDCRDRRDISTGAGVQVFGGQLAVRGGAFEQCGGGVSVCDSEGGEVTVVGVQGVAFGGCMHGVEALDEVDLDVLDCEFRGLGREEPRSGAAAPRQTTAVFVRTSRRLSVCNATVSHVMHGITALKCADVLVKGCSFSAMEEMRGASCVFADSEAVISGCAFRGAHNCITCHQKCTVEDCKFASSTHGVMALAACAVRRCKFGPGVDQGVATEHDGRARVDECEFTSCHIAMNASTNSEVIAHDCVCTNTYHCMYACKVGGSLSGTRIRTTGGPRAVVAGCGTASTIRVTLTDCDFGSGLVFLQQGVAAEVVRCTVSNTQTGIQVTGTATARVKSCKVSGCEYGITVGDTEDALRRGPCWACSAHPHDWQRPMWAAQRARHRAGTLLQPGGHCPHDGAIAQLAIEDTEIRDCSVIGLGLSPNGHCDAARVRVVRCNAGLQEVFFFTRSQYKQCVAVLRRGAPNLMRAVCIIRMLGPQRSFGEELLPVPDGWEIETE